MTDDDKHDVPKAPPGTQVVPRPAASLLVYRTAAQAPHSGPHLLMARRAAGHRFMPNVLVFPGGAVDPADHGAPVATPLRPAVRARLERSATAGLAHALAAAAARELTEEVGVTLGTPPDLAVLDFVCRAVTPPDRAMRFDAYFFAVDAAHVHGDLRASAELEDPGWYTLEQALAAELAGATKAILAQFTAWLSAPVHDGPVPVLRDRRWVNE